MTIHNSRCLFCNKPFHACACRACGHIEDWKDEYCSEECWKQTTFKFNIQKCEDVWVVYADDHTVRAAFSGDLAQFEAENYLAWKNERIAEGRARQMANPPFGKLKRLVESAKGIYLPSAIEEPTYGDGGPNDDADDGPNVVN